MESTDSAVRARSAGTGTDKVLMDNKPLHRFLRREPRSLGIVLLIFGCAELLMGFQLIGEESSNEIYIPFWLGALFTVSGICSIYTDLHPSKKMVTVCLSMYVVSILGIAVSIGYRLYSFSHLTYLLYRRGKYSHRTYQVICIEVLLFISSLCVFGIFIFLCVVARFALKSTHSQVIVQCVPAPPAKSSD